MRKKIDKVLKNAKNFSKPTTNKLKKIKKCFFNLLSDISFKS